jgi:glycosyltransferase involved in cell wall biosynthesis
MTPKSQVTPFQPQISVVMPCFQQVAFLEEAVRSVLEQSVDVELLVMDPGSTDGSRELLRSLQGEFGERLVLHFAPDRGQSDAINRGMGLARGRILAWLNSDDRLRPGALAKVASCLEGDEPAWIYGRAGMIDDQGRPVSTLIVRYKNWRGRRFTPFKLLTENFIPQMATFWTRTLWQRAGELNLEKELDMDYDLWFRFARIVQPRVVHEVLADFRIHGEAKGSVRADEQLLAAYATARSHAPGYGIRGKMALAVHLLCSWRTRILYFFLKP